MSKICSDVLRCSQMFSDDYRCFWIFFRYSKYFLLMFSRCSLDVPRMFAGFFQDVFRMLRCVLWAWWNLMIISNESMEFILMIQRNSMIPNYFLCLQLSAVAYLVFGDCVCLPIRLGALFFISVCICVSAFGRPLSGASLSSNSHLCSGLLH